jgi:endonuclease/exonuclease/phosphatase family metal-dependent hydrolase
MILSRLPVLQAYRHLLPYPADHEVPSMPRVAVEAVVRADVGEVRVVTTHLEYYSQRKRAAQVDALRAIYAEGHAYATNPRVGLPDEGPYVAQPRPANTVITGDFNLEPDDPLHARMEEPFGDGTPPLFDAWQVAHPGKPHDPTFKIYEKKEPAEPELHCDFIFVSESLRARVSKLWVDTVTQVSDHQPVLLELR